MIQLTCLLGLPCTSKGPSRPCIKVGVQPGSMACQGVPSGHSPPACRGCRRPWKKSPWGSPPGASVSSSRRFKGTCTPVPGPALTQAAKSQAAARHGLFEPTCCSMASALTRFSAVRCPEMEKCTPSILASICVMSAEPAQECRTRPACMGVYDVPYQNLADLQCCQQ